MLQKCLKALNRQTVCPLEIIIVDNNSTDSSLDAARNRTSNVKIVTLDRNIGFAGANNIGLSHVKDCTWTALLNPDAFPQENWLEKLLESCENYTKFSFFGSLLLQAQNTEILDGAGDIYHVSGAAWRASEGRSACSHTPASPTEIFSPCAAAAIYRTRALRQVNGFDKSFFCYFEDMDLSWRLRHSGHRCLLVPDAKVLHMGSAITERHSAFSVYFGHRNMVWTFFKNMPSPLFQRYIPQHIMLNLATILLFTRKGQFSAILRAKYDALRGLKQILKKRRLLMKNSRLNLTGTQKLMGKKFLMPYIRGFEVHRKGKKQ